MNKTIKTAAVSTTMMLLSFVALSSATPIHAAENCTTGSYGQVNCRPTPTPTPSPKVIYREGQTQTHTPTDTALDTPTLMLLSGAGVMALSSLALRAKLAAL